MPYTFKQRANDKGFDFFKSDGTKTTIEDYAKNTGANQSNLRTMMAQRGDQQSQQIMRQAPVQSKLPSQFTAPKQPTLGDFAGEWLKTAGDFGKNTANFASDVGKGIVNSVGNTIGLLDPTINSQQRDERFQQSIPGAVYKPLDVIGTTLGTSLGAADLSNKGYDPNIITQAMNEQTNRVGIDTNADSGVNARKIAGAGLETVLNLATMGNPLTGSLKTRLGAETGKVIEGKAILDALRQSGGNLLPTLMNSSKGQAVTGALSGAASTLQQDTINPSDIIKNAAMGYAGGRVMGAATPLINKALSGLSSKDSIARSQMVIAKGLDELPAGSPQRQTLIQQMIETTKAKVQASKEEAYLKSPIGRAEQHPSIKGWDANLNMLKSEGEKAIANGQTAKAKQIAKAYQDASIKKMNETKALEQKFINQDTKAKQGGYIQLPGKEKVYRGTANDLTPDRINFLKTKGYTSFIDESGNKVGEVKVMNSLNPTGGIVTEYKPQERATMPLGENITTFDKTANISPDEMVTIYRGAPKSQKNINAGDFITTNKELAKSYTGDGNVIEMKVPAKHILDDITEPLGDEYIYRPTNPKFNPFPTGRAGESGFAKASMFDPTGKLGKEVPKLTEEQYLAQNNAGLSYRFSMVVLFLPLQLCLCILGAVVLY